MRKKILSFLVLFCITIGCSVFTACKKEVDFSIKFIVNDSVYAVIETKGNEIISMPENPNIDGYTFDGWFWDNNIWQRPFTANSLLNEPLSSDMKVYAKFTPIHVHSYSSRVIEPDCFNGGYTLFACACGDSYTAEFVNKLDHDFEDTTIPATCTADGYDSHYCKRCKNTYKDNYVTKLDHDFEDTTIPATCTTDGYDSHYCKRCKNTYKDNYVTKLGHTYEETIIPATCTEMGYTQHLCHCNHKYFDNYTNMLPHQEIIDYAVEPTVTTTGLTQGVHCDVCKQILVKQNIIDKKLIDFVVGVENGQVYTNSLYLIVDKDVSVLQLGSMIVVQDNGDWDLFKDSACTNKISSKVTGELNNGDNTYYIRRKIGSAYTGSILSIKIHRIYETSVSYYDGTTLLKTDKLYTNQNFKPTYVPDLYGYNFISWKAKDKNSTTSEHIIMGYESFEVVKNPKSFNITFDLDGGTYAFETMPVTFGESFFLGKPTKQHYDFAGWEYDGELITDSDGQGISNWNIDSENIKLKATYNLTTYNISYEYYVDDEKVDIGNVRAGYVCIYQNDKLNFKTSVTAFSEMTFEIWTNLGYEFVGYYLGDELLSANDLYIHQALNNAIVKIKWQMVEEMKSFNFDSSSSTCTITSVKDNITNVCIPSFVTSIGSNFGNSETLEYIDVAEDSSRFSSIDGVLFSKDKTKLIIYPNNHKDKSYEIPNMVETISNKAFDGSNIISVVIPENVKTISSSAFAYCEHLTNVEIEYGVEEIFNYAFAYCYSLESFIMPDSVISVDTNVFKDCFNLKSFEFSDNESLQVSEGVLSGCSSLETLTIPHCFRSVHNIYHIATIFGVYYSYDVINNASAFQISLYDGSDSLYFAIPKSLKHINFKGTILANSFFAGCDYLETITFNNIEELRISFNNCSITTIIYNGTIDSWKSVTKDSKWLKDSQVQVVKCSDGDITI